MHKRLFPKVNAFTYGIYYLSVPLSSIDAMPIPVDRFGLLSFHRKDHGARDGTDLKDWLSATLNTHGIKTDGETILICMPRVLGYVFNPVSFWMCFNKDKSLRAVLCEVNNTFGETHSYICAHDDGHALTGEDILTGEKVFHVSPFLNREGQYRFRFNLKDEIFGVWIDHDAQDGRPLLLTALTGRFEPMTNKSLGHAFWGYPLVTLKAIFLIHWQAVKLFIKGIKYVSKPQQSVEKTSLIKNIKKM